MTPPHFTKTGQGPNVVCLHSSTSSSKQWGRLVEQYSDRFTFITPDLYGYGKSPDWDTVKVLELDDEIDLIQPALDTINGPFHLIGHSYGAAVAFRLALRFPERVISLVGYEPVLFNLLFQANDLAAAGEIFMVQDDVYWLLTADRYNDAARLFIDYWSGDGAFDRLPDWQQDVIKKRMQKVRADFDATLGHLTPLEAFGKLNLPVLLMYGLQSPQASRRVAEWLGEKLPRAEIRGLLPTGHMGPLTHADQINRMIMQYISGQPTEACDL